MKLYPFPIIVVDEKLFRARHSSRECSPKVIVTTYGQDGRLYSGWWLPKVLEGPSLGGYWSNKTGKISGL